MEDLDLTSLSAEALDALLLRVRGEQERRNRLADTPAEITAMAERYIADGGNVADLAAALPA